MYQGGTTIRYILGCIMFCYQDIFQHMAISPTTFWIFLHMSFVALLWQISVRLFVFCCSCLLGKFKPNSQQQLAHQSIPGLYSWKQWQAKESWSCVDIHHLPRHIRNWNWKKKKLISMLALLHFPLPQLCNMKATVTQKHCELCSTSLVH